MKNKFCGLSIGLAVFAGITSIHASVAFTNLVFFTYTNPPDYGWNNNSQGHTSALAQGNDGNFYGTTYSGGPSNIANFLSPGEIGTVFKMTPDGTFTSLYSFGNVLGDCSVSLDGQYPVGNLIKGADGNLYGTTTDGGTLDCIDEGTLFQITTNGALTTLYSFGHNLAGDTNAPFNGAYTNSDGGHPFAGIVQGGDGYFYGTTSTLGAEDGGTVFQFIPGGPLNTLFTFPDTLVATFGTYGESPFSELVEGSDGNFYGTTYYGGTNGFGTIFQITTNGALTVLHSFNGGSEGGGTYSPLVQGTDGNFYGTTPVGSGAGGGAGKYGTVFKITTNGIFAILHTFTSGNDGGGPTGGLIQGSDGNFYGTTQSGGAYRSPNVVGGTIFQITTNGTLTTFYSFSGPDGQEPQSALAQGKDGNLYGTTSSGGPGYEPESGPTGYGTIFRITIPPAFQTITRTNGIVSLTWSAMSNQVCQLQYSANLVSPNWINLGSAITVTNSPVSASDATATDSQRFYQIMLTQ